LSRFGNIRLAKICRYAGSEHSKGTAFVHFGSAEEADECLLGIRKYPFITLDGRHIFGDRALPRCAIAKLEKEKHETQRQDRRNLFLLRASYVRPDDGPDKMSVQDERKREGFRAIAMQKMKNPHM
uniref:RRM domain-containing protein n=1 Tax=Gongylonema pulchrum TaxID=637853 RepID=A0A183DEP6_9BILA